MYPSSEGRKLIASRLDAANDRALATRTDEERATAILNLLAPGPLMKWQLRERLQEPESVIKRTLVQLRAACLVKSVMLPGEGLNNRGWALVTFQRAAPLQLVEPSRVLKPRKSAAAPSSVDSFWLNLPRERFTAECVERAKRMHEAR